MSKRHMQLTGDDIPFEFPAKHARQVDRLAQTSVEHRTPHVLAWRTKGESGGDGFRLPLRADDRATSVRPVVQLIYKA